MSADVPHPDATQLRTQLAELHPAAWGWALACCRGDRPRAEEVLHMSYHRILDGRARFNGRASFKTWLFGVIRLTALDERRWNIRRWLRFLPFSTAGEPAADSAAGAHPLVHEERRAAVRLALAQLAPRQSEVLHLVFYQELTLDDAAGVMGVSPGTARTHYERGKAALRRLLGSPDDLR